WSANSLSKIGSRVAVKPSAPLDPALLVSPGAVSLCYPAWESLPDARRPVGNFLPAASAPDIQCAARGVAHTSLSFGGPLRLRRRSSAPLRTPSAILVAHSPYLSD